MRDARRDAAGRVHVSVSGADRAAVEHAVHGNGGAVERAISGGVAAFVPEARLAALASSPGVDAVERARPFLPSVTSEGVSETNATAWHNAVPAKTGAGQKIAIVDVGFTGYAAKVGTELPAVTTNFGLCTNPQTTTHGTAVAEIAYDMAPGAALYLICIEDSVDFNAAADYIVAQGITIANLSGGFLLSGRGDGSGSDTTPAGVVRRTRLLGVLWTVSAGNMADRHFAVGGSDLDNDGYIELFHGEFGDPIQPGFDFNEFYAFEVAPFGTAQVGIQWDAWVGAAQDIDVLLFDLTDPQVPLVAQSTETQGPGVPPTEAMAVTNASNTPRNYMVVAYRAGANAATRRFDLWLNGSITGVDWMTPAGSVTEPATSPYAMAVGAHCFGSGAVEPFSSRGPTIDERVKPDISGPDATTSSVYGPASGCFGGFTGTSAAAPHVAGAAAVVRGANPALDVAELQSYLERRASPAGDPGLDNAYGFGLLELGAVTTPAPPVGQPFGSPTAPVRIMDTRPSSCVGGRCSALAAGETYQLSVAGQTFGGNLIPANATAVIVNVTAVTPAGGGYVTLYPAGGSRPLVASLNYAAGDVVGNNVTATIGNSGKVNIYTLAQTHLVVDLVGYYAPGGLVGLKPLSSPTRVIETRSSVPGGCIGPKCGLVAHGETITLPVRNQTFGGTHIPTTASAVVLNVTAVPSATGWLTVWPGSETRPLISSLNFNAGVVKGSLVYAKIGSGTNGSIKLYNFTPGGSSHIIVDLLGYYDAGGAGYVALTPPRRDLDTRMGNGPRLGALTPGETYLHQVRLLYGVPSQATVGLFNLTAVTPTGSGFITAFPTGSGLPLAANLNFAPGQIVGNAVLAKIGTQGRVSLFNSNGSFTHLVADLTGYFEP